MTKRACRGMGKDYHRGCRVSKNKSVPFFFFIFIDLFFLKRLSAKPA